jgi:hypothetical protein
VAGLHAGAEGVERVGIGAETRRLAADLVERHQPVVAVERRVLHALGHGRRRQLLEAQSQLGLQRAGHAQQQQVGQEPQQLAVQVGPRRRGRRDRRLDAPAVGV